MSYRRISQADARALAKRVEEMEAQRKDALNLYCKVYPGGVHLGSLPVEKDGWFYGSLKTAQRLGCALVAKLDADTGDLRIYAVKP